MENASIQAFMSQYEISMQLMKMHGNGPRPVEAESGVDRYRCRITRPGREVQLYVVAPSEGGSLTPSDVLFMLILDASGCEMLKDYYERQDEFDEVANTFYEFWIEYESRCKQTRKLKAFLGKNLYEELISQFGFNN